MPIQAEDLLDRLDNYHKEIVQFAQETTQNAQTLKTATDIVNSQKDTTWAKVKTAMPLILIVLAILGILLMKPANVCQVSISVDKGLEIKQCEQKTVPKAN
jgi:hypothetical protein